MNRLMLTVASVVALTAITAQAADKKCFQLADDDPLLMTECPPIKLGQGEAPGMMSGNGSFNSDGPQNRNRNRNNNQNNSQNQNANGNGAGGNP